MGTMLMGISTQIFHTSKAGVIVIAAMFVIGIVVFKLQANAMQHKEKDFAQKNVRDEFEAEDQNDYYEDEDGYEGDMDFAEERF